EMRVAFNAELGQMDNRHIATMSIHGVPPFPRHLQTHAPYILPRIRCRFLRNEITVVDNDGNLREQHEFSQRDSHCLQRPTGTLNRGGPFAFREYETAARFIGDNGADVLVLYCRAPAEAAAVRMGDKNPWSDFVEKRRYSARHHLTLERACGWGHLAKVLIQRLWVA